MDNKSSVYTKAVREDGFVFSLNAKQDSIMDAMEDIKQIILDIIDCPIYVYCSPIDLFSVGINITHCFIYRFPTFA